MRTLFFLLLVFAALPATAEIYRWVDAQGHVHFGARPAAGAEQIQVRPQVIERDEATRQREERTRRFFDARREEQQAAGQLASDEQARRANECRQLRNQLTNLTKGGRYFRNDANGERVYYSDDEMNAARRQLASRIDQLCS